MAEHTMRLEAAYKKLSTRHIGDAEHESFTVWKVSVKRAGFTLIELLVVIVVIATLPQRGTQPPGKPWLEARSRHEPMESAREVT